LTLEKQKMPIYEFRCQSCKRKFEKNFTYQEYGTIKVACPYCASDQVARTIGRIRVAKNSTQHLTDLADPANLDQIDQDPKALGKMMKELKNDIGTDMGGEFDEVVDRLEQGQSPDEIDQAFPDIGGED
jgi:putative FmdB family regulatory protein